MNNKNIGIINYLITNKLKTSYFDDNLLKESKTIVSNFISMLNESPILQLEYKVYNNLINKNISDENKAIRYIDNNIKLFETFTTNELIVERNKLSQFNVDSDINENDIILYESIDTLITESVKLPHEVDVDKIHESFTIVLNHLMKPENKINENELTHHNINEDVVEIAIDKYNEKYSSLEEEDRKLLLKLIKSNKSEKSELFESLKNEVLNTLNGLGNKNLDEKVNKAIEKINEIKYNCKTIDDDIIKLHELKKGLF
jgi:hypothetical protein